MKKSKKLIIILSVVVMILIGVLIGGYIVVNKMFSAFSDSFYQTTIPPGGETSGEAIEDPGVSSGETTGEASQEPAVELPSHLNLSSEEAQKMIDAVSFSDKLAVMSLLSANLKSADYRELVGMLKGGITPEEIKRAKEILNSGLTAEQKKKVLAYYGKYSYLLE